MYFDNLNSAQHRLTTLYKLQLVDRFQPLDHRYASLRYHYVLDQLGAMVVAAERGEDPGTSRWRADTALAIGKSQRLRHLTGMNGFFSALAAESRHRDDCDLSLWWSERHCMERFDRIAQPDGLGVWEEAGTRGSLAQATAPLATAPPWGRHSERRTPFGRRSATTACG